MRTIQLVIILDCIRKKKKRFRTNFVIYRTNIYIVWVVLYYIIVNIKRLNYILLAIYNKQTGIMVYLIDFYEFAIFQHIYLTNI